MVENNYLNLLYLLYSTFYFNRNHFQTNQIFNNTFKRVYWFPRSKVKIRKLLKVTVGSGDQSYNYYFIDLKSWMHKVIFNYYHLQQSHAHQLSQTSISNSITTQAFSINIWRVLVKQIAHDWGYISVICVITTDS